MFTALKHWNKWSWRLKRLPDYSYFSHMKDHFPERHCVSKQVPSRRSLWLCFPSLPPPPHNGEVLLQSQPQGSACTHQTWGNVGSCQISSAYKPAEHSTCAVRTDFKSLTIDCWTTQYQTNAFHAIIVFQNS